MDRPIIGLNTEIIEDEKGISYFHRSRYSQAVWDAGGRPVLIPPVEGADPASILRGLHGVVMIGGDDLSPCLYGGTERHEEEVPVHPLRETFDLPLIREAVRLGIPLLAICLGIQELSVAFGGTLHPYLPDAVSDGVDHRTAEGEITSHTIEMEPGSRLFAILGSSQEVNSKHRQAVKEPGAGLKAVAFTGDGVIEAVEGTGSPFLLGVQWHPELMWDDPSRERLFSALIREACDFKRSPEDR